jgi:hypothetical protein
VESANSPSGDSTSRWRADEGEAGEITGRDDALSPTWCPPQTRTAVSQWLDGPQLETDGRRIIGWQKSFESVLPG